MTQFRTVNITIIANQPKFQYPSQITVNSDFELFGNLPLLAVYGELFRTTQDQLAKAKLDDLYDVDGVYRDPNTFAFHTEKGYIELKLTLLPISANPSTIQIDFNHMNMIHESHLMLKKGFKQGNKIHGIYGLCMINVLNPTHNNELLTIAETDQHVLQANVVVDLSSRTMEFTDTVKPNNLRMFEVEMAYLFFGYPKVQELIVKSAEYVHERKEDSFVFSTFLAMHKDRNKTIDQIISQGAFETDFFESHFE